MSSVRQLLANNRAWAASMVEHDPTFFQTLSLQQSPGFLWIGCSDSRVPANQIVGLLPGQLFVHRNVANVVVHSDLNCLSVMQFAVEVLEVQHIIVCGHYGCGGIMAAFHNRTLGLIDNWLRHVQDVRHKHAGLLEAISNEDQCLNRLCELNVIEQVVNVCQTTIVQSAWRQGKQLAVHGWIYGLHNGLLRDLRISVTTPDELTTSYQQALAAEA